MFSITEKTLKPAPAIQQKATGTSFFKKAGEEGFFGAKENPTFFNAQVQAKLKVSSPDDPQEKEADAVADKVMRMTEPVSAAPLPDKEEKFQRQEEKEEVQPKAEPGLAKKIQTKANSEEQLSAKLSSTSLWLARKAASNQETLGSSSETNIHIIRNNETVFPAELTPHSGRGSPPNSTTSFDQTLAASKGGGSAMLDGTRQFMENRFAADFSGIRIHTGPAAEQLSTSIQAQAFTHGNNLYFNQNKYSPDSTAGRTLLAHELTHTIQQDTSPVKYKAAPKKLSQLPLGLNTTVAQVTRADAIDLNRKEYTAISRALAAPNTSAATSGNIDLSGKSGGSTMPGEVKEFLQDHFQTSVDDIRIHLDDDAAGICRMLRVPAFTQGRHICFDPSRYAPETEEGGLLLAKQVAESFKQRSIKVAGGVGSLNAAAQEAKKEGQSSPAAAKPAQPETGLPKSKDKKKKAAREGKDTKGKKGGKGAKEKKVKGDADTGKAVKANPKKSPASPDEDPAFQKVVKKAKSKAKYQQQHEAADAKAAHAQKAATAVPNEAQSKAQKRKTEAMEEVAKEDKPFDAASFKADLLKKIEAITPKNLEEATEFKENNRIGEVKGAMGQKVASEKEKSAGPVEQVTEQPLAVNEGDNKKPEPLPPTVKGTPPGNIGAREAAPKKKLDNEISMEEQSQSLDEEMKTNNITEEQLAKSNEPSFVSGLREKKAAQKDAKEKPLLYRKQEAQIQQEAQLASEGEASRSMGAMFATRGKNFEGVVKQQQTAKTKDEAERAAVVQKIEGMYKNTESVVNALLTVAETTANTIFDTGSEKARQDFETYVDGEMRAYKRKRYSGFWGGLRWAKDKLVGMPDAVNKFYEVGRERYLAQMNTVISQVANVVTTNLNAAKQAIKNGKKEIEDYVNGLEGSLQNVGKEAAESIQDKFDALEQTVNDKRDQLIDGLAQKYVANLKKLDDRITELKEANKGLVQKAIGMLKEIWKVIKNLYQLFQTILSRIASVIGLIINDPGAFFSNLGKAFKQGFDRFQSRIGEHLENGLMIWLSTQLGVSNLKLPPKFDIGAILNLVLQVLGVSFATIKERAIILFGAKKVEMMEKGVEIFQRIQKDGLGAIWDMLVEKLSDFKDIVWEAIKNFIRDSVVRAAITFVLSLLNPVAAFVKACMAIYDFVMMLVRMKDRILDLLNAILDAVALIASGSVDKAAAAVENAFAKSIPVIIGFLAALLHLNDIGAKVRGIITRIRDRIFKVIDWVLQKIYNGAKLVIDKLMGAARGAVGGGGTPQERLDNGLNDAQKAVNRYAGKKVGAMVLKPLLGTIKLKYGFQSLDVEPEGANWAIIGHVNPNGKRGTNVPVDNEGAEEVLKGRSLDIFKLAKRRYANKLFSTRELSEHVGIDVSGTRRYIQNWKDNNLAFQFATSESGDTETQYTFDASQRNIRREAVRRSGETNFDELVEKYKIMYRQVLKSRRTLQWDTAWSDNEKRQRIDTYREEFRDAIVDKYLDSLEDLDAEVIQSPHIPAELNAVTGVIFELWLERNTIMVRTPRPQFAKNYRRSKHLSQNRDADGYNGDVLIEAKTLYEDGPPSGAEQEQMIDYRKILTSPKIPWVKSKTEKQEFSRVDYQFTRTSVKDIWAPFINSIIGGARARAVVQP